MKSNTLSYPSRTRRRDPAFHQPSVCSLNVPSPLQPQAFAPAVPSTRNTLTQSLAAPRHSSLNSNVASSNDTRTPPAKGAWCSPQPPTPHPTFTFFTTSSQSRLLLIICLFPLNSQLPEGSDHMLVFTEVSSDPSTMPGTW